MPAHARPGRRPTVEAGKTAEIIARLQKIAANPNYYKGVARGRYQMALQKRDKKEATGTLFVLAADGTRLAAQCTVEVVKLENRNRRLTGKVVETTSLVDEKGRVAVSAGTILGTTLSMDLSQPY